MEDAVHSRQDVHLVDWVEEWDSRRQTGCDGWVQCSTRTKEDACYAASEKRFSILARMVRYWPGAVSARQAGLKAELTKVVDRPLMRHIIMVLINRVGFQLGKE